MNGDIFDSGIPKYSTAADIYDALCTLTETEEMGILSQMFPDVSYENQEYYYTDKGSLLKDRFEEISDSGDKMWLLDLAIWKIDQSEVNDIVYMALTNSDLAKRISFRSLFIEYMLSGNKADYNSIIEAYLSELTELNRFDNYEMIKAWNKVMAARGKPCYNTPYPTFSHHLIDKLNGLKLDKECQLIIECRSLLTSYDDFMLGLKMNQALYETQEASYQKKLAALREAYSKKVNLLMLAAERVGLQSALSTELKKLDGDGMGLIESFGTPITEQ